MDKAEETSLTNGGTQTTKKWKSKSNKNLRIHKTHQLQRPWLRKLKRKTQSKSDNLETKLKDEILKQGEMV